MRWLQKLYWINFAQPVEDRELYRTLIQRPATSILELGVGDGSRLRRMSQVQRVFGTTDSVRYIGTDEFESATDGRRHLTLKQAHQMASQLGFKKASLIPGDIQSALPRVAHKFGASDLIIVGCGYQATTLADSFVGPWLNRIAHDRSIILACRNSGEKLELVRWDCSDAAARAA